MRGIPTWCSAANSTSLQILIRGTNTSSHSLIVMLILIGITIRNLCLSLKLIMFVDSNVYIFWMIWFYDWNVNSLTRMILMKLLRMRSSIRVVGIHLLILVHRCEIVHWRRRSWRSSFQMRIGRIALAHGLIELDLCSLSSPEGYRTLFFLEDWGKEKKGEVLQNESVKGWRSRREEEW